MKNLNIEFISSKVSDARDAFIRCINNKDNLYLQEEITFPIGQIIMKFEKIEIHQESDEIHSYIIKTTINLMSPNSEAIGYYTYIENEKSEILDDVLVLY